MINPMVRPEHQPEAVMNLARVCHEANRAYCLALGDDSQPHWEDAPTWQKESAYLGVEFHLNHPDAGPAGSHESWLDVKRHAGWVYGPVKDPEKKEHPCMVPYEELPYEQRLKDALFVGIVHALKGGSVQ
jgi:RyR domain